MTERDHDNKRPDTDTDGVPPAVERNMGNLIFDILSLRQRKNIPGEMHEDLLELSSWRWSKVKLILFKQRWYNICKLKWRKQRQLF